MKAHIRQLRHNAPENRPLQLRHETKIPYLSSYGHETNETKINRSNNGASYEHAYTPASKSPRIAPKNSSSSYGMRQEIPIWTATTMRQ